MARTIKQIKTELTTAYITNDAVRKEYEISDTDTKSFDEQFSKVSIESILFYVVAFAMHTLERLFDQYVIDVDAMIANLKPHTLSWYVQKAKDFRLNGILIPGTDKYDPTEKQGAAIVDFAAAAESKGLVQLKVATRNEEDNREPLSESQLSSLEAYMAQIKDAGVQIQFINEDGYLLKLSLQIYYNHQILESHGYNILNPESGEDNAIDIAIKNFIENLPFNGELILAHLVDTLQDVHGVMIPVVRESKYSANGRNYEDLDVKLAPASGYFQYDKNNISITYTPYYGNI